MSSETLEELQAIDYPVKVSFDPHDGVYVAEFFDLPGCSAYGDSVEEAYRRAQESKNEWLRVSYEQGLPIPKPSQAQEYSGRILARVPSTLHAMLSDKAKLHGVSLNQYIVHLLSAGVVGDEISMQLDQLTAKVSQLECRVGQLTASLKMQPQAAQTTVSVSTRTIGANVYAAYLRSAYQDQLVAQYHVATPHPIFTDAVIAAQPPESSAPRATQLTRRK